VLRITTYSSNAVELKHTDATHMYVSVL
jgi:hypothetical protein